MEQDIKIAMTKSLSYMGLLEDCESSYGRKNIPYNEIVDRLNRAMNMGNPFTDPNLTLVKLSRLVGTNRTYLSLSIHKSYGVDFRGYINGLRCSFAKSLLLNKKEFPKWFVESVAMDSGFVSERAFRDAFFKIYGISLKDFLAQTI